MATLNSRSTDAEVLAAYDDNALYEEDGSRAKAECVHHGLSHLAEPAAPVRRTWLADVHPGLQAEIAAAKAWLDAPPATAGAGSGRVRYFNMENFRG